MQFRESMNLPPLPSEQDNGLGAKLGRLVFDHGIVAPIRKSLRRREQQRRLQAAPQSIPVIFTNDRSDGWNCHIDLEVTGVAEDGTTKTVSLTHDTRAPHTAEGSTTQQGKAIVIRTLTDVSEQLRAKGL